MHNEKTSDELILASLDVALFAVNPACQVTRFNQQAEELTHIDGAQALGMPCFRVLQNGSCPLGCPLREALRLGASGCAGTVVLKAPGQPALPVEMTASALFDPEGKTIGAVAILRQVNAESVPMRFFGSRTLVSRLQAMHRIFLSLPDFASSQAPLLILGQRGSGRGVLAETVHCVKHNRQPLLRIGCSEMGEGRTLSGELERYFYSHNRSGTLLLEDVEAADSRLQQDLLGYLEDTADITVRLVSTSTPKLPEMVKNGGFRQDLFYRLNVLQVEVPSLEQRRQDIPLLVDQFMKDLNSQRGHNKQLTNNARQQLVEASYPGNITELRHILKTAYQKSRDRFIRRQNLAL